MTTIYLAGPDVFLATAIAMGTAKKELCARHGFDGLFPLDAELAQEHTADLSTRIFDANMEALNRCDAVIAHLTPFRGVSADVGTVFEVAHALAIGKPVFAYSNVAEDLFHRVAAHIGLEPGSDTTGRDIARDGMVVENFGLADNLMIVESIRRQGWDLVTRPIARDAILTDLSGFEACLLMAARHYAAPLDRSAAA